MQLKSDLQVCSALNIPKSEFVESPELFSPEEEIADTSYSGTNGDASSDALLTTKDFSASHKKLLLQRI